MKKIELIFYHTKPSPENVGLKQVLYKVTSSVGIDYDFGYCNWDGEWELPDVPEGIEIEVHSWANNTDPKFLINESKLIKL